MKHISTADLAQLAQQAQASPRLRANLNLHPELNDPIQRLAIAMEPATVVLPHRHPHTFELLYPLQGRFLVLHFDDAGVVIARSILGEDSAVIETAAGVWHAVLSLDVGGVIFEVKHGPYAPLPAEDIAPWAAGVDAAALLASYAQAQIGQRLALEE